jgi:hypothetical protein
VFDCSQLLYSSNPRIPAYHHSVWWSLLFIGYVLVVAWFLMAIVLATIYTVYKSGLKVCVITHNSSPLMTN